MPTAGSRLLEFAQESGQYQAVRKHFLGDELLRKRSLERAEQGFAVKYRSGSQIVHRPEQPHIQQIDFEHIPILVRRKGR